MSFQNILNKSLKRSQLILALWMGVLAASGCAQRSSSLDAYVSAQEKKIVQKNIYIEGELLFWAGAMTVNQKDLDDLRTAWQDHSKAFPQSKSIEDLEREVRRGSVVVVALYMTDFEKADLLNKTLGWSAYPVAGFAKELSESDAVLRTLFPLKNPWAKFFLLRYDSHLLDHSSALVIANREGKVELKLNP